MRFKLPLTRAAATAAGLLLLGLYLAPGARARIRCSYSGPPTNLLTVRAGEFDLGEITRDGPEIVVVFSNERTFEDERTRCSGGTPMVFNTDTIRVRGDLDLRLDSGPFAPGATPEAVGGPEIEVQFTRGVLLGTVIGTRRADEFHWGPAGANSGLNLNPGIGGDQDVDVTAEGDSSLVADGAGGSDRIIPAPGAVFPIDDGVFSHGGRGDDLLIAPRKTGGILIGDSGNDIVIGGNPRDLLSGGFGRDRVEGRGGRDRIRGGPGRDLLLGGRGNDHIHSRDKSRDRVMCGPGRDKARADRRDRVRGCEVTRRH